MPKAKSKGGQRKVSSLKEASKQMYKSMSQTKLREMAKTKRKNKPMRVIKQP